MCRSQGFWTQLKDEGGVRVCEPWCVRCGSGRHGRRRQRACERWPGGQCRHQPLDVRDVPHDANASSTDVIVGSGNGTAAMVAGATIPGAIAGTALAPSDDSARPALRGKRDIAQQRPCGEQSRCDGSGGDGRLASRSRWRPDGEPPVPRRHPRLPWRLARPTRVAIVHSVVPRGDRAPPTGTRPGARAGDLSGRRLPVGVGDARRLCVMCRLKPKWSHRDRTEPRVGWRLHPTPLSETKQLPSHIVRCVKGVPQRRLGGVHTRAWSSRSTSPGSVRVAAVEEHGSDGECGDGVAAEQQGVLHSCEGNGEGFRI